jgi:hypothetical protein
MCQSSQFVKHHKITRNKLHFVPANEDCPEMNRPLKHIFLHALGTVTLVTEPVQCELETSGDKDIGIFISYLFYYYIRSRNSLVGIATGYGLNNRGVGIRVPVE